MIIVRISSGLGNQLFQYAFYNLMKKTYPETEVYADVTTWFNKNSEHHGYELENIFSNVENSLFEINRASAGNMWKTTGIIPNMYTGSFGKKWDKVLRYPNRVIREFTEKSVEPYILDQLDGSLSNEDLIDENGKVRNAFFEKVMNLDTSKNWLITGYYIEEKYYESVHDLLLDKLVFPDFNRVVGNITSENQSQVNRNKEYAELIQSSDSVSLHVRRGDYLSDFYKDRFISLGEEYYKKAVEYIDGITSGGAKYFIFSDDKEFVENAFDWLPNKVIVTGNEGTNSFRDMQLMSLCKHNIIANSTFSQWGSLLNKNKNHKTVYPKAYMADKDNEIKKDQNWIRL